MSNRRTALITEATSGIGSELTTLFADNSFDLVLVAKNEEDLENLNQKLKEKYRIIKIYTITKDLAEPKSPVEIYEETSKLGIEINILVNNAGFGEYGKFIETDLIKELAIIQTNISSLVYLTKVYLKDMIARNEGKILQLATISSYQHTPLQAVYAASKAFVLSFTNSLIEELKGTNVTMTALIPGSTNTDFLNIDKATESKKTQRKVADEGFEALMEGEHSAIIGAENELLVGLNNIMSIETITKIAQEQLEKNKK